MIGHLMIYCVATSLLLAIGALALERVAAWRGWQRRSIWAVALAAAILIPAVRMVSSHDSSTPSRHRVITFANAPLADMREVVSHYSVPRGPLHVDVSDKALGLAWAVTSTSLLLFYCLGAAGMWRNARRWQPSDIDGRRVWVTDVIGPAVYGFFRPRILLPQWIIDGTASSRKLVLDHEQEHIKARDHWLLLFGLLAVAAAPWNIPSWWQLRRLRFAIEVDCDARVMGRGADPRMYGLALLGIAERRSHIPLGAMGLTEPASQLRRRVQIMTASRPRRNLMVVCGVLGCSLACVAMAARLDPPAVSASAASNDPQTPDTDKTSGTDQWKFINGCDPSTGKPVQSVTVLSGKHALGSWSGESTDIRTFVMPNGFKLGLQIEPAPPEVYARFAQAFHAKYVPELVRIALFDMTAAVPRQITETYGGVTSIQGYGPHGGADRVVEIGEPGIRLILSKQQCVPASQ